MVEPLDSTNRFGSALTRCTTVPPGGWTASVPNADICSPLPTCASDPMLMPGGGPTFTVTLSDVMFGALAVIVVVQGSEELPP